MAFLFTSGHFFWLPGVLLGSRVFFIVSGILGSEVDDARGGCRRCFFMVLALLVY
jgi:hypothetical protein